MKKMFSKMISTMLSFMLVLTLAAVPMAVSAEGVTETQKVYFGNGRFGDSFSEQNLSDFYVYDDTAKSYTRTAKDFAQWPEWKYPMIMAGVHRSFVLEFDINYTAIASDGGRQWVMVDVGREKYTAGWENGSGAERVLMGIEEVVSDQDPTVNKFIVQSRNLDCFGKETSNSGWVGYHAGFDYRSTVHAKITVSGAAIKAEYSIGDTALQTATNTLSSDYNGGYVALGANCKGVKLSNISVYDIQDGSGYAYYGPADKVKTIYNLTDHYTVSQATSIDPISGEETVSDKYTRNDRNADGKGWDRASFVSFGAHNNFKLTFKGKYIGTGVEQYITVAYGEKLAGDGRASKGSGYIKFGVQSTGKTNIFHGAYDYSCWSDNGSDYKWLNGGKAPVSIDVAEEHIFSVEIKDNILTFDIDNGAYTMRCAVNALYGQGGFVGIGVNRKDAYFYDVNIEDLTPSTEETVYLRDSNGIVTKSPEAVDKYYTVTTDSQGNKSYTRKSTARGDWYYNVPFLTIGNYKNFRMEFDFDYTNATGYKNNNLDEALMWLNIGNLRENGVRKNYGSHIIAARQSNNGGYIEFSRTDTVDGKSSIVSKVGWMDSYNPSAINYRGGRLIRTTELTGHIIITVKDNYLTLQHGESMVNFELSDLYRGGFVQLGVNTEGIQLSNITIAETGDADTPFTMYYTDSLGTYQNGTTASTTGNLTKVKTDRDWSYDGSTLAYKPGISGNAHNNKMSVAYYNARTYHEFEMTFEYRAQYNNPIYVGFGAAMGKSWMTNTRVYNERLWQPDPGNHVVFIRNNGIACIGPSASYLSGSDSNWFFDSGTLNKSGTLFKTDNEYAAFHTATIRVENGKALIVIDGNIQGIQKLNSDYDGGYVYFASNLYGTVFRNIRIVSLEDASEAYNIDGFTAYYSDKVSDDDSINVPLTEVNASDYWNYDSTTAVISRKLTAAATESDKSDSTAAYKTEWAQLTYNTRMDGNFELEADVTNGYEHWQRAYIGIGAENMNAMFMQEDGGIGAHVYPDSPRINLAGNLWSMKGYQYEWRGTNENAVSNRTNHVKITVQNRLISYYLNNELVTQWAFPEWYEGGYVYFASNSSYAAFSDIRINGIDAMETVTGTNLSGKSALFVGDSISVGVDDTAMAYAWGGRIGRKYGMYWVNNSNGGANIAEYGDRDTRTIVDQIKEHADKNFDYVIIEGGVNDAMNKLPAGKISTSYNIDDFDITTFAGALETAFAYVTDRWPNAHIGFIVTFQNRWITQDGTRAHYNVARTICQKWNVPYLDLNGSAVAETLDIENKTYLPDGIHPNTDAYDLLVENYIEKWMLNQNTWGGLDGYARGDFDPNGQTDATDISMLRQHLIGGDILVDFSAPDIYGEYVSCTPDLNGDTQFNIMDLVRIKKIAAGLS